MKKTIIFKEKEIQGNTTFIKEKIEEILKKVVV